MIRPSFAPLFGLMLLLATAFLCPAPVSAQQILINELRDINFGRAVPSGGTLRADLQFCVVLDQNATYQVLAYGEEVGGDFTLNSGPFRLPYVARFTDRRRARGFRRLFPGQPLTGLRVRGNNNGVCNRPNAGVRIVLRSSDLQQASAGSYRGTLSLMVSPE